MDISDLEYILNLPTDLLDFLSNQDLYHLSQTSLDIYNQIQSILKRRKFQYFENEILPTLPIQIFIAYIENPFTIIYELHIRILWRRI